MESEDFERLLKICRLSLGRSEKAKIKRQIDDIIDYFDTIESVDCDKYSPSYQPIDIPSKKRKDKPEQFHDAGKLLRNSKIYRFFIVGPKI
jgi:aspartyl/glutamyl-tRNA(Asn/Gln) amidotransferase C subunit